MAINKVTRDGVALIDLSADTVTSAADIVSGKKGHLQNGEQVTGTYTGIVPTGNKELTQQSGTDVTNYETASVRSGSVTLNTPTINTSTGVVTASASVGTSGWVGSAPSSKTLSLTTQAAKTVTPSASSQTAVAAQRYTTGAVTVAAVPSETKTVDLSMASGNQTVSATSGKWMTSVTVNKPATLLAENIKSGVNIGGVNGTLQPAKTEQSKTLTLGAAAPATVTPDSGKVLSSVPVVLDTSVIKAENIAKDVTMLGVTGTHEGGGGGGGETWVFNDDIQRTMVGPFQVNFEIQGEEREYCGIGTDGSIDFSLRAYWFNTYYMEVNNSIMFAYERPLPPEWMTSKTITLQRPATGDFLTWLQANAVKQ